jgi:hypothetical protein
MSNIERRSFDSAQSAFDSLDADSVKFSHLAKQKLKQLGTALKDGFFRPAYGNSVDALMRELLGSNSVARLSYINKSWKCVKVKGSDKVCFYSDSYGLDPDKANALALVCSNAGLDLRIFELDYPGVEFGSGYFPPKNAIVMGYGYKQLYRGTLIGFVVGAYDNPHETRTTKRRKLG